MRAEAKIRLQEALNSMDPVDREVLSLRHFEQLSLTETAQVLGLTESGASRRHLRAVIAVAAPTPAHGRGEGVDRSAAARTTSPTPAGVLTTRARSTR